MKKTYKSPVVLTVRINSITLLTVSNPKINGGEYQENDPKLSPYYDNFDEEEDW